MLDLSANASGITEVAIPPELRESNSGEVLLLRSMIINDNFISNNSIGNSDRTAREGGEEDEIGEEGEGGGGGTGINPRTGSEVMALLGSASLLLFAAV